MNFKLQKYIMEYGPRFSVGTPQGFVRFSLSSLPDFTMATNKQKPSAFFGALTASGALGQQVYISASRSSNRT